MSAETLRPWIRQAAVDAGEVTGVSSDAVATWMTPRTGQKAPNR
jgi:hypothetical protein